MVDVPQLLGLNINGLEAAGAAWAGVGTKLNSAKDAFTTAVVDPLKNQKWKGEAGQNATAVCDNIRLDIEAVATEANAVQRFLHDVANGSGDGFASLGKHQQDLVELHHEVIGQGLTMASDGTVGWSEFRAPGPLTPEEQQRHAQKNAQADALTQRAKAILKAATDIDDVLKRGLKVIFGGEDNFRTENRNRHTKDGNLADDVAESQLRGVQGYLGVKGWHDAADLLEHYLDASGDPVRIDANRLLKDVPTFQSAVNGTLGDVRALPDGPFQTAWKPTSSPANVNLNWYYALNNFSYRVVGEKHGNQLTYHVEVQKRYDWGIPSEHRRDLDKGPIHFEQAELARLNAVGRAKDFDVHGSTDTMTSP